MERLGPNVQYNCS